MCSRFTITHIRAEVAEFFGLINASFDFEPRYNVAPGQRIPVVRYVAPEGDQPAYRELVFLKWGLVPMWAKPFTPPATTPLLNARSETVTEKPAFREAIRYRRCLVPADGFIEWETVGGKKQPHWFHLENGHQFAFAAIWEPPARGAREEIPTVAILTVAANDDVAEYHDRMPAILLPGQFAAWLDPEAEFGVALDLLQPMPRGTIASHPVCTAINHPQNEGPELLRPIVTGLFG